MTRRIFFWLAFLALLLPAAAQALARRTRNVILVMTDGLRWQEVFTGADFRLLDGKSGSPAPDALQREFWRPSAQQRRQALLPFLWSTVATQGQIFGNPALRSEAAVSNGLNFSYPGYSETLCGVADPRIDSNDKKPNPNVNVLEYLNARPGFERRAAAFGAWELFPWILNAPRSGLLVNAGFEPLTVPPVGAQLELLNTLKPEAGLWDGEPFDTFTFHTARDYFLRHKPRVLFLSLGETDEWAHAGRYDLYLKAARRFDRYAAELWRLAQSLPEYRDQTTLILAVDHGRGSSRKSWRSHGRRRPESRFVWMAFLGPDTPPLGERRGTAAVSQSQIAATLAALLGEDFRSAVAAAAAPIRDVLP